MLADLKCVFEKMENRSKESFSFAIVSLRYCLICYQLKTPHPINGLCVYHIWKWRHAAIGVLAVLSEEGV